MKLEGRAMKRNPADRVGGHAGWLAMLCAVVAAIGFGAALDGYSQAQHPLALLGARGVPRALAFNLAGFVLPGLLAAVAAIVLRRRLPANAGWLARIGAQLLLLSALAFALQGLLPLDSADLDGPVSRRHAIAWTLWWIAAAAGGMAIAAGLLRQREWRVFACAALVAALVIAVTAMAPPATWPAGIAPRIALCAWLGLWVLAARTGAVRGDGGVSRSARIAR